MVATATMVGAIMGLSCQFYSNGVRKLPLMRHPWEHLLAIGIGAGFGNAVAKWEVRLQEDLDKKLSEVEGANRKRFIGKQAPISFYGYRIEGVRHCETLNPLIGNEIVGRYQIVNVR